MTPWQTIGPFFPGGFFGPEDHDLARGATGETVWLLGTVREEGGVPCVNAVLEAWQHNAGWGRARTDAAGHYRFRTMMPAGFADAAGQRAPQVNLLILASGIMSRLLTACFFPGFEAANAADPVLRALPASLRPLLLARAAGEVEGARAFRFDILLRGAPEAETPFLTA